MLQTIYRHVILPLYEGGLHGRTVFPRWAELEQSQWLPRAELERRQLAGLRAILRHAYASCPYYRESWSCLGLDPATVQDREAFARWPVLDRDTVRTHRQAMRSTQAGQHLLTKTTGGSSGAPLAFELDCPSHDQRVAAAYRGYRWAGAPPGTRQLHLWGVPLGQRSWWRRCKDYLYHRIHRRIVLNTFELSEETLPELLRRFNRYRPEVVVAYTGPLYVFARMLAERRLRPVPPRSIIVGAEKLHPFQRELIEEVFGAPVFETYGCREFMLIGAECERHEGLHLTMEHLLVEVLDDDGHPVPDGAEGNVVITDLANRGMPFIRYANGDRAIAGFAECPCGRGLPLLRQVIGRRLDVLQTPDGRQVPGEFFPHLLKDYPAVKQFQVVQEALDRIELRLVLDARWGQAEESMLRREVQQVLGPAVRFFLVQVDAIPLSRSGKLQVVVNRIAAGCPAGRSEA
jgi:phenylacetate-CoA ligase